ncbi:MAG: DNA-formamidopyrimidine glycosylase family protein [Solirubrobacteraceae bacterium]
MPELPEVEATVRLLGAALRGATVESTLAPGVNVLKTFDPPLHALDGSKVADLRRRGKLVLLDADSEAHGGLSLVAHLMSAGRLQLFDKRASLRDRTSRLLVRLDGGRELRLREFGTRQAAWVRLHRREDLPQDDHLRDLGPEAWPHPPDAARLRELLSSARPLHTQLRDQKVIAGIGRTWVDDVLHAAGLSPFKRGDDLSEPEASALRAAIVGELGRAVEHYAGHWRLPLPDKQAKVARVHAHQGEPCPRCDAVLEAVFFEDHVMTYCPHCQTSGRVLKDRRLSRLLK